MYDILLVDDDRVLLEAIGKMLSHRFRVAGLAANGKEALNILEHTHVDVLLTDISMPVMNGLELIARVTKERPEMKIAVLSNYDDFIFIKEAMRMGAVDYLRKGDLDEETIMQALLSMFGKDSEPARLENVRRIEQQHFWEQLMRGAVSVDAAAGFLARKENVCCILVAVRFKWPPDAETARRLLKQLPRPDGGGEWLAIAEDTWLLPAWQDTVSRQTLANLRAQLLIRVLSALNETAQKAPYYALYADVSSIHLLVKRAAQIKEGLEEAFYAGFLKSAALSESGAHKPVDDAFFARWEARLLESLRFQPEAFAGEFEEFFGALYQARFFPAEVLHHCYILLIKLLDSIRGEPVELPEMGDFLQTKTLQELKAAMSLALSHSAKLSGGVPKRTEIANVMAYIHKHYAEALTVDAVADIANMSRTHFSALFKMETGQTFVEYVNHYRIERAKKHLMSESYRVHEIAELVGIADYRYFCKLFRRYTGKQPKDYKYNV